MTQKETGTCSRICLEVEYYESQVSVEYKRFSTTTTPIYTSFGFQSQGCCDESERSRRSRWSDTNTAAFHARIVRRGESPISSGTFRCSRPISSDTELAIKSSLGYVHYCNTTISRMVSYLQVPCPAQDTFIANPVSKDKPHYLCLCTIITCSLDSTAPWLLPLGRRVSRFGINITTHFRLQDPSPQWTGPSPCPP